MNWTEVTDVVKIGNPTVVYLGRSRHYISQGDGLTYWGDSQQGGLQNGETYKYIGQTSDEPNDAVILEWVQSDINPPARIKLYREDFIRCLIDGFFEIHDA